MFSNRSSGFTRRYRIRRFQRPDPTLENPPFPVAQFPLLKDLALFHIPELHPDGEGSLALVG
jgi:hypothetical protein